METLSENGILAQNIVQEILKAKKQLKLYPANNPIYIKTIEDTFQRFDSFFELHDELTLKIKPNEIFFSNEKIYENPHKDDNFALFFFKDGVREVTFIKGFTRKEFEDFMTILYTDFENVAVNDDIVTLLWEKNFEHIKYIADESFLLDEEEDKQQRFYENVKDKLYSDEDLMKAYYDGMKAVEEKPNITIKLTDLDLQYISQDIEEEKRPKIDKVLKILIEILHLWKDKGFFSETVDFMSNALLFCVRSGDFGRAESIVRSVKSVLEKSALDKDKERTLNKIFTFINSESFIREIGSAVDQERDVEEEQLKAFIKNMDRSAVPVFMQLLGEMQTIKGRRLLIEVLSILGKLDIDAIVKGLYDERWYVVRNVILILGKIADRTAFQHLVNILSHPEERVRKEIIKVMGDIESFNILPHLKKTLGDPETSVRMTAVRTLGSVRSEGAKKILLEEISKKAFLPKDFSEKKEFYEAITHWDDQDIKEFLRARLDKKGFWRKTRHYEARACAAYAIGLMGDRDAIPSLQKAQGSKNKILQKFSASALKQLKS
jgi:HEAT repeat protein